MSRYGNVPFDLPEGWCWCKVEDVCVIINGNTVDKSFEKASGQIPYIKVGDMNLPENTEQILRAKLFLDNPPRIVPINSIIFPKRGGAIMTNKKRKILKTDVWIDLNIMALHVIDKDLFEYFNLWFSSINLGQLCNGGNIPQINYGDIAYLQIPLPPVSEQNKIVETVEKILALVDKIGYETESLSGNIKQTKSKILDLAISGKLVPQDPTDEPAIELLKRINPAFKPCDNPHYPFEVPYGWRLCSIGDLFHHNTGKALNASNHSGMPFPYITTSNLYWDRFDMSEIRRMLFTDTEIEKCRVQKGDLLVCEGGDIGRAAIWIDSAPIMIQNHIHKLRPKTDICTRFYLYVFMLYKGKGMIGGKGIGILGLSSRELDRMVIPVPPVDEQYRITNRIDALFSILSDLRTLSES